MGIENRVALREKKIIYRNNNELVKLFDNSYSRSNILNEALNQVRVEETGLKIPQLREVTSIDNKWAIKMDFVEGKTLEELLKENPKKEDEYLKLFVETQMNIHSKKSPLLTDLILKLNRKIDETNLNESTKFDLHSRISEFSPHDKVLHGDFALSNVIITPKKEVFVVDWAHATKGNASADVALSYLLFILDGKESLAEKYINLYSKMSGTEVHYIKKWVSIVAAANLNKCEKNKKEQLMKFINVMDYQ